MTASKLAEELLEIGRRCAALPDRDHRGADEILGYNESGGLDPRPEKCRRTA